MDRLALVPENEEDHEVLPIITRAFQDAFRINKYPNNVAENIKKYTVDDKFESIKTNAVAVVKLVEEQDARTEDIHQTEMEMMRSHAMAMVEKQRISNQPCAGEMLKLKRHGLFQKLSEHAIQTYGLIQQTDLYPNRIEQYLDFTFNPTLHTCSPCTPNEAKPELVTRMKRQLLKAESEEAISPPLELEPEEIIFKNYELDHTYKLKFKLRNVSRSPQVFNHYDFPKDCPFRLEMLSPSCRLAAGMSAEFVVSFRPKTYKNHSEWLRFKTTPRHKLVLLVTCTREPPKLICYVYNPLLPPDEIEKPGPESRYFSERRRDALNCTIDCGSCLLGNYSLVTLIMKNVGQKGQFFVTTENEWFFNELNISSTRAKELSQGCFSIFPVCFEIDPGEVCEIFALFLPDKEGVFTEKIVIICDNNSHQEIELLGDCTAFSNHFLKVDMYLMDNTFCYAHRLVEIVLAPYETSAFILSIINDGPISFEHFWAMKGGETRHEGKKRMGVDWIELIHNTKCLPSFSTTDIVVQLTAKSSEEGVFYIYMSLYLAKIPIVSMPECHFFVVKNYDDLKGCTNQCLNSITLTKEQLRSDKLFNTIYKFADVHLCELEIACVVKFPEIPEPPPAEEEIQQFAVDLTAEQDESVPRKYPRLKLTQQYLNFGIIPKGVQVSKSFSIESLSKEEINWKLIEIRCNNAMELEKCTEVGSLSCCRGTMKKPGDKKKITYTIEAKSATRWISILALFSSTACSCEDFAIESICLVIYEVAEIKISIRTGNMLPVLCPKEFIYVGIPTAHTIYVHNSGVVVGCFYFLKPQGVEASKMQIKFQPQSGTVLPGETIQVKAQLTASENGVFEDLFVPCFTGDPERLNSLRILCTVASINIHFYLPNEGRGHNRILWPPKSETKLDWTTMEARGEDWLPISNNPDGGESPEELRIEEPTIDASLKCLIAANSVAATYPTVKVKPVRVKKAARIRFYIENLTPIHGNFVVEATNYGPDHDCANHRLVKAKLRPPEHFWEKACLDGHGIVIEPHPSSRSILPHEVIEIDLWVYANTWGKYLEEVIVEINDLTPFCFNLIVDVVGSPLEFPFAKNTILEHPTIRFENITYTSDDNERSFTVTNISSVPLHISWYIFVPEYEPGPFNIIIEMDEDRVGLQLSPHYYGALACPGCVELKPLESVLEKQSTVTMTVTIKVCECRPVSIYKTSLKYDLIGFIHLRNEDRFKENYFRRVCGVDLTPAKVNVLVTLELPILEIDLSSDDTVTDLFVNDILLNHIDDPRMYLLLRNIAVAPINLSIQIDKPFQILEARTVPTGMANLENLVLHRHECLQVMLTCHFSHEELLQFAEFIYKVDGHQRNEITELTSVIKKDLCIQQEGAPRQMIAFEVRLHYPKLEVKPAFVKFGQCLLYRTKKTLLSIYNVTGSPVNFEIYKTSQRDYFEINPSYGVIPASTGANKQFVDVVLYFTPRQCDLYIESLRIVTNIPQYFIDVPIAGHGSNNEKFYVD